MRPDVGKRPCIVCGRETEIICLDHGGWTLVKVPDASPWMGVAFVDGVPQLFVACGNACARLFLSRPTRFAGRSSVGSDPPHQTPLDPDLVLFGLPAFFTRAQLDASYRELALRHHPDRGGSNTKMTEINLAMERLKLRIR